MAGNTQASLKIIFDLGREKCSIKMGQLTPESGQEKKDMALESL